LENPNQNLKKGFHWYVVYMKDNSEKIIQARSQNEAEKIANDKYLGNLGVAYTEL
jgi:hypothetical protein